MGQSEVHSLKAELRKSILDDRLVNKVENIIGNIIIL